MRARVAIIVRWLGRAGVAFVLLLAAYLLLRWIAPASSFRPVLLAAWVIAGIWFAVQSALLMWRLRHRLLMTYLFIAVVPITLIVGLAALAGYLLVGQVAVHLATSELEHRIEGLAAATDSVARISESSRASAIPGILGPLRERYPNLQMLIREAGKEFRYPQDATPPAPRGGWESMRGILSRDGRFFLWSFLRTNRGDITATVPLTDEFLAGLTPDLGLVVAGSARAGPAGYRLPPRVNRLDADVLWPTTLFAADWDQPGPASKPFVIAVWTRISAVLATVFNRGDDYQRTLQAVLIAGVVVLVVVEILSLVAGVRMARTITGTVHHLYEGTERVMEGDFAHRIEVTGTDQLAELSVSFNHMTENLERLLAVAKEKERLQSEIEIAREVQSQLYPRAAPSSKTLRVAATCKPARIVSGDYYDYETIRDGQVAMAIGDVAGKGISAALLMASLQSSMRTQLSASGNEPLSTAWLVDLLNQHLYENTSLEKFASFYLGIYNEASSSLTYTNAGHVPPVLLRNGAARRLEVNGTVVGAFPSSKYDCSQLTLKSGDLLVCFTDGITEPENEFGEMFGEGRLIDLLSRNVDRSEEEIIGIVLESVRQWTGSDELQDDMTLLLARRV